MDLQNLKVITRQNSGKGVARKTRRDERVPAILYGGGRDTVRLSIDFRIFDVLLHGKQGEHAIVQLDIEGHPDLSGPAIVKEVQHHPVRGQVTHADFMRIRLDEKIRTHIPVRLEGQAPGVVEGGVLDHQMREVEVECLALDVPEFLAVDVSELEMGQTLHVDAIEVDDGITLITALDRALVACHAPRVIVEEEEVAEGEEALAEGEEAEGEEKEGEEKEGEEKAADKGEK